MGMNGLQADRLVVERTRNQVLELLTRCIMDIRKTVTASGLSLRDVGIRVEEQRISDDSFIVDLKVVL
ncbi:MAG: hypothetical protein ACLQDF_10190 [Desulfomonilia bacterium]